MSPTRELPRADVGQAAPRGGAGAAVALVEDLSWERRGGPRALRRLVARPGFTGRVPAVLDPRVWSGAVAIDILAVLVSRRGLLICSRIR